VRRGKWADDFMARFPVSQQYDFYNHDPKVVDKARELAGMGGLLILLNTDGHKNELCVLKGSKAASREGKSGCFIATAAYRSEIEPDPQPALHLFNFTIGSHHQLLQLFQKSIGSEYLLDFSFSNRCYRLLKRFLLTTILPLRSNNGHCKGHSTEFR